MPLLDHFGILAPFYESVIRPRAPEKLVSLARLPVAGALLDAGGGTGRIAQYLVGQVGRVIVADSSDGMLRQAAAKAGLSLVLSPTEALPFPDASFERVIMVDAFHHVSDQTLTACELWRVLRPGGRLIIEEPDVSTLAVRIVAVAEKLAMMRSHFLKPEKIATRFAFPGARAQILTESYTAWIVIDKMN